MKQPIIVYITRKQCLCFPLLSIFSHTFKDRDRIAVQLIDPNAVTLQTSDEKDVCQKSSTKFRFTNLNSSNHFLARKIIIIVVSLNVVNYRVFVNVILFSEY